MAALTMPPPAPVRNRFKPVLFCRRPSQKSNRVEQPKRHWLQGKLAQLNYLFLRGRLKG